MIDSAILDRRIDAARISPDGLDSEIAANAEERAAIVGAYDLVAVDALSANVTLTHGPRGSVEVSGRVLADIVQSCVVTLEPVAQHIDEPIAVRFVPADSPDAPGPAKPGKEVVVDADAPDPPEVMEGTSVNLGALVEEIFVLAIDPYPRAPGAELPAEAAEPPESAADSPFAMLRDVGKGKA